MKKLAVPVIPPNIQYGASLLFDTSYVVSLLLSVLRSNGFGHGLFDCEKGYIYLLISEI
jgi:hypothetical protein